MTYSYGSVLFLLQAEEDSLASDSIAALGEYFYASYLACYLIVGDLSSAKYLWKRAPANLKVQESGSMLCEVWTVGKALWQNDYISAITSLSTEWPDYLKPLTFTLREKLLLSQLDTIARAYDVLSVELLSTKLGINQEETIQSKNNFKLRYPSYESWFNALRIPYITSYFAGAQACGWVIEGDSARSSRIAQSDNLGDNLSESKYSHSHNSCSLSTKLTLIH